MDLTGAVRHLLLVSRSKEFVEHPEEKLGREAGLKATDEVALLLLRVRCRWKRREIIWLFERIYALCDVRVVVAVPAWPWAAA